jgi:hypothetical protein
MKQIEEEVAPFGIRMDGTNDEELGLLLKVGIGRDSWLVAENDDSMSLAISSNPQSTKKPANRSILGIPDDI